MNMKKDIHPQYFEESKVIIFQDPTYLKCSHHPKHSLHTKVWNTSFL